MALIEEYSSKLYAIEDTFSKLTILMLIFIFPLLSSL